MPLTQETFLGASIRSFSGTAGWGTQPSTLEVGLVEDPTNGDSFNPPEVGNAIYFDYQGWTFGGLLQSYTQSYGQDGNPVFNVQVQDPRQILEGVKLILNDYTGTTYGIPNIYNVYGYLENAYGFGGARANDTGMPWTMVRDAFAQLQLLTPIYWRGDTYRVFPFAGLDVLPYYYRVGSGSDVISVLDFIDEICAAIAADYVFDMTYDSDYGNLIHFHLVSRRLPMRTGSIEEFVTNVEGAEAKDVGYEYANTPTSKFVVGGKVINMYFQEQTYTANNRPNIPFTYYDDTIAPFWGYDAFDNLIIGNGNYVTAISGDGSDYQFRIDGRPMYIQTGDPILINYVTDLAEMRFAAADQDSWEAFLWWKNDDPRSIHRGKAARFGLMEGVNSALKAGLGDDVPMRHTDTLPAERSRLFEDAVRAKKVTRIYEHIRHYATEYYGRKFMVRIPFVFGAFEPETNNIIFSVEPVDKGYLDESVWGQTAWMGYTPFNLEKFTDPQDNRIECYVRFANMQSFNHASNIQCKYALDQLSPDDYILDQYPNLSIGRMRENLFVRATADPKLVFLDKRTLFSPRVVITLSAPIAEHEDQDFTANLGLINEIKTWMNENNIPPDVHAKKEATLKKQFGSECAWFGKEATYFMPDLAVIPLQSNILRYGPWYATSDPGAVEYEVNDTLVPWTYGGYTIMNYTGLSKVEDALTAQPVSERGTITFPGAPSIKLGHALVDSGPAVTDVSVTVGEDGVKTTYRMNTWSWQFGRLGKYNIERFQRMSKLALEQRKAFRSAFGYRQPIELSARQAGLLTRRSSRALRGSSSANLLGGDVIIGGSGNSYEVKTNVAAIAGYRILSQIDSDSYRYKAAISLDGVFVPFTTDTTDITLPHFEAPAAGAAIPNVLQLNPFSGDSGIGMALPATNDIPQNLISSHTGYDGPVRAIGLKAPIIVGGWGYDTSGNPVPASGAQFYPNYKNRADLWKVGPLDIRWDDDRKVWNASGGGGGIAVARMITMLERQGVGSGVLYARYQNPTTQRFSWRSAYQTIQIHDWLMSQGQQLYSGDYAIVGQMSEGYWVLINASCPC